MKMYTFLALLLVPTLSFALSIPSPPPSSLQNPRLADEPSLTCDCSNTHSSGPRTNPPSICNDDRLGPIKLPDKLRLLSAVSFYDRFGSDTPGQNLAKWTNKTTGKWLWPEGEGFSLDVNGEPIKGSMMLKVGTEVDRFGSENGTFVAAADAPFDQRSLPPSSLNIDPKDKDTAYPYGYHIYKVEKEFIVEGGPIADLVGQPGLGAQFKTKVVGTVWQLIVRGYLTRVPKRNVTPNPGESGRCRR